MNYFFKKITVFFFIGVSSLLTVSAAQIIIESAPQASSNRQPFVVRVFLDPEQDTLSGLAGNFSFPTDLFSIDSIATESSVVSLWVKQPEISEEKYLDNRTHITFEGIFPGGYNGVRSPGYSGTQPGILFSITLISKSKGVGSFVVDDIELNSYDANATPLSVASTIKTIHVPDLTVPPSASQKAVTQVTSPTLSALVTRDESINNNAWYLVINEREQKSAIAAIYVAETNDTNAFVVDSMRWRLAKSPFPLFYQDRSKYIHIKVVYSNNTYTTMTLQPVENYTRISLRSRILISILIMFLVMYFYGSKHLTTFRKKI